jgi:hypothetical protein
MQMYLHSPEGNKHHTEIHKTERKGNPAQDVSAPVFQPSGARLKHHSYHLAAITGNRQPLAYETHDTKQTLRGGMSAELVHSGGCCSSTGATRCMHMGGGLFHTGCVLAQHSRHVDGQVYPVHAALGTYWCNTQLCSCRPRGGSAMCTTQVAAGSFPLFHNCTRCCWD